MDELKPPSFWQEVAKEWKDETPNPTIPLREKLLKVFALPTLNHTTKILYAVIALTGKGNPVSLRYDQLADAAVICTKTLRLSLRQLEQDGFIETTRIGRKPNIYRIL